MNGPKKTGRSDSPASLIDWMLIIPVNGLGLSLVFGFVVSRFAKFSHLSNDIFRGLEFENPEDVDLPKRLREASKAFTVEEHFKYHPHAGFTSIEWAARLRR